MNGLRAALSTEWLKARRSRVPWLVLVGFSLAPAVVGLFMVILKDPDGARRLGLLGAKAQLAAGTADWPTMLSMLAQAVAVGGAILFAFLTSWVYGREFADRTLRGLLASPTSRGAIVVAKAIVVGVWGLAITAWIVVLGFGVGMLVGLPGWSDELAADSLRRIVAAALLTIALQPVTGLLASIGRGYIAGLGWAVLTVAVAQVLAVLGLGAAFPWAVPALISAAAGPEASDVPPASLVLVGLTGLAGLVAAIAWWRRADHTG
jgi:ABC-2 type transport system permease protein